jgi:hypothetical protein
MVRSVDKFIAVLHLPRGIYYYRFYGSLKKKITTMKTLFLLCFTVDGKWSFLPEHPNVMTRKGQKLNVFDISNYRCKYYQIAKEYQKVEKTFSFSQLLDSMEFSKSSLVLALDKCYIFKT